MNMIKETRQDMKNIKKSSLQHCFSPDKVTNDLWNWSEHLERLGIFFIVGSIIIGVVVAIYTTLQIDSNDFFQQSYYSYYASFDTSAYNTAKVTNFIGWLLGFVFFGVVQYIICHSIAIILGAYAGISQNTRATALMTKLYIENTCEFADDGATGLSGMAAMKIEEEKTWVCKKCGAKNSQRELRCKDCGMDRNGSKTSLNVPNVPKF